MTLRDALAKIGFAPSARPVAAILADFNRVVTELEARKSECITEINDIDEATRKLTEEREAMFAEATRASAVAERLRALLTP